MKTKCLCSLIASRNFNVVVIIACVFLIFVSGCKKDENVLIGTWKCIGFGNSETQAFRQIEPQDCDYCYEVSFQNDGIFTCRTYTNGYCWDYSIRNDSIKFLNASGTEVGELYDGKEFNNAIKLTYLFQLDEHRELKLYYTGEEFNYLLFKSI